MPDNPLFGKFDRVVAASMKSTRPTPRKKAKRKKKAKKPKKEGL